jgi:hypothetical protein
MRRLFPTACFMLGIVFGSVVMACGSSPETKPPPSCLQALDAAEVVIGKASDALGIVGRAIDSFIAGDVQAVYDANGDLQSLGDSVGNDADDYRKLAEECRAND